MNSTIPMYRLKPSSRIPSLNLEVDCGLVHLRHILARAFCALAPDRLTRNAVVSMTSIDAALELGLAFSPIRLRGVLARLDG